MVKNEARVPMPSDVHSGIPMTTDTVIYKKGDDGKMSGNFYPPHHYYYVVVMVIYVKGR